VVREQIRTPEGDAATEVVLEILRASGLVFDAGNRIAAQVGLTAARWQVLGALAVAERPLTVPQIARRMGLSRQAVQASVNRLLAGALVESGENLDHRRSPLITLTELGQQKYGELDRRQIRWINELSTGLEPSELGNAACLLHGLSDRLEKTAGIGRRGNDDDASWDGRQGQLPAATAG
jgi:DNA-binding MarR family transcriptional regulator